MPWNVRIVHSQNMLDASSELPGNRGQPEGQVRRSIESDAQQCRKHAKCQQRQKKEEQVQLEPETVRS